jgi:hypothetical protein
LVIFAVADDDPATVPTNPFDGTDVALFRKGDVLVFNAGHVATLTDDDSPSLWEFNGPINPHRWGHSDVQDHIDVRTQQDRRLVTTITWYPLGGD